MYTAFYGLREKPFSLTPNPRFLYLTDAHKEALRAALAAEIPGQANQFRHKDRLTDADLQFPDLPIHVN